MSTNKHDIIISRQDFIALGRKCRPQTDDMINLVGKTGFALLTQINEKISGINERISGAPAKIASLEEKNLGYVKLLEELLILKNGTSELSTEDRERLEIRFEPAIESIRAKMLTCVNQIEEQRGILPPSPELLSIQSRMDTAYNAVYKLKEGSTEETVLSKKASQFDMIGLQSVIPNCLDKFHKILASESKLSPTVPTVTTEEPTNRGPTY